MKKHIVMLLLTITVLSLSACASGKETEEKDNVEQETVDETVNNIDEEQDDQEKMIKK